MSTAATGQQGHRARIAARAAGNVLLGIAVGLLAYYAITDVESGLARRTLRGDLEKLGPVGASTPPAVKATTNAAPVLDFEGWNATDELFWRETNFGDVIGRIVIERIGLDSAVLKGTDRNVLKGGPGWIVTTSVPGPEGNCAISGHRTTYLAPFRNLNRLRDGDTIDLYTPYRRYRYRVTRSFEVRPWQVEVIAPTDHPVLTLTACHPPYSAKYRLIVQSDLVDARRLAGAPASVPQ